MTTGEGSHINGKRPAAVLPLEGAVDVATAAAAHKRMLALDLRPGMDLVLDLSAVTFLDSTGIRLILQAHDHALLRGAGLVLVRGPEPVQRVLALVGLAEQLHIVDRL